MKKGFTLIELLVVVLIIGILAAIALPQYNKAVEKSRMAELPPLLNSLISARERYFLATGSYGTSFDELDIEFNGTSGNKHHFDAMNIVGKYNKNSAIYIGYPVYRDCVFAMTARGKYYPQYDYGNGLGYCFEEDSLWFPNRKIFCLENTNLKEGEFCSSVMGYKKLYGTVWHRYFIKE